MEALASCKEHINQLLNVLKELNANDDMKNVSFNKEEDILNELNSLETISKQKEQILNEHKQNLQMLNELVQSYRNEINTFETKKKGVDTQINNLINELININEKKKKEEIEKIENKYNESLNKLKERKKNIDIEIKEDKQLKEEEQHNLNESVNMSKEEKHDLNKKEENTQEQENKVVQDEICWDNVYDETKFKGSSCSYVPPEFSKSTCKVVEKPKTISKSVKENKKEEQNTCQPQQINEEVNIKGLKQIESLCEMKKDKVLFDSLLPNGKSNEVFYSSVMNHSNIAIIMFDSFGNEFGGFIRRPITASNKLLIDDDHFLFTLGKGNDIHKFKQNYGTSSGIYIHSKDSDEMFFFGNEDDGWLSIRKTPKSVCCALKELYDMSEWSINGTSGEGFTVERIIVIQML